MAQDKKWTFGAQQAPQNQGHSQVPYSSQTPSQQGLKPRLTELQALQRDLIEERPDWVFTAYGNPWSPTLVGNDTSFEEARLHESEQLRNGVSMSQVIHDTNGFRQQALSIFEAFLTHRFKIAGQNPPALTQPKWNFGRAPVGQDSKQGQSHPIMFGGAQRLANYVPYVTPKAPSTGQSSLPAGKAANAPSRPMEFKSSLFGASPQAMNAFSNASTVQSGIQTLLVYYLARSLYSLDRFLLWVMLFMIHFICIIIFPDKIKAVGPQLSVLPHQLASTHDADDENMGDTDSQEENPWTAPAFIGMIPEDPPPEEYIKPVTV